jgi:protein-S-isoprenylcysteine O-methyltransferase Ste14
MTIGETTPPTRTRRILAVFGTALFFLFAPGTVTVLIPWWISRWRVHPPFPGFTALRIVGVLWIAAALPVLLESFARFALQGVGTPAPVFPTQRLVVRGFYCYVRNPMYLAVVAIVFGQALLLGNIRLLVYGLTAWLITHLFVLFYEEPTLRKSFGAEFTAYCEHVPRWLPRRTRWLAQADSR